MARFKKGSKANQANQRGAPDDDPEVNPKLNKEDCKAIEVGPVVPFDKNTELATEKEGSESAADDDDDDGGGGKESAKDKLLKALRGKTVEITAKNLLWKAKECRVLPPFHTVRKMLQWP